MSWLKQVVQELEAEPNARGEDRSSYQVADAPWKGWGFGFAKATEGTFLIDSAFATNWENLNHAGIPRGAYCFFHPGDNPEAQADLLYDTVHKHGIKDGDMFVLDVEIFSGGALSGARLRRQGADSTVEDLGVTGATLDALALRCLNRLRYRLGSKHPILVYTDGAVGQYLHETAAAFPDLWFAHPGGVPTPALIAPFTYWRFWQTGVVSNTDRDEYFGSVKALHHWIARYEPAKPPAFPPWQEKAMNKLPTLKQGDRDRHGEVAFVRRVQSLLRGVWGYDCPVDGNFDAHTERAVKTLQTVFKVAADGVVGPLTWDVLITGR